MPEQKKNIATMLEEQMKGSEEFAKRNFGLKLGSDFPEIARELLKSRPISVKLLTDWLMNRLGGDNVADRARRSKSPEEIVADSPEIYQFPFKFFYWGLQIGRQLERDQAAMLKAIAEEEG